MVDQSAIQAAKEHFGQVLEGQLERVARLKDEGPWLNFDNINPIVIGILGGDGIGPTIVSEAQRVLEYLLSSHTKSGRVEFRTTNWVVHSDFEQAKYSLP